MAKSTTNGKPKLLTRLVKGVGHWLGPETPTGKAFVGLEKGLTKTFDRLGRSDRYLNFVGRTLNRGLITFIRSRPCCRSSEISQFCG